MAHKDFLTLSSLILLSSILSGCSSFGFFQDKPTEKIVTQTQVIEKNIPIAQRPKPVQMASVRLYVVTEDNYEEFKQRFLETNPNLVFYAFSVPDYEHLALNMAELKRYILQQKEIIIYYENAVKPVEKPVAQ